MIKLEISGSIFLLIVITNHFGIVINIFFGLLIICVTTFGPSFIYYAYSLLSPTYPNGCKYGFIGTVFCLLLILYYIDLITYVFYGLLTLCGLILGPIILLNMNLNILFKKPGQKRTQSVTNSKNLFEKLVMRESHFNVKGIKDLPRFPLIFSRQVDGALQNFLDLVFKDFVRFWLCEITPKADELMNIAKQDIWVAIQNVQARVAHVDSTNLIAHNIVNTITFHLVKIRKAEESANSGEDPKYKFFPHLESEKEELEYLRKVSEVFILFFMPQGYTYSPTNDFLREVLSCKIMKPIIDTMTDPDYINQKILLYIEHQKLADTFHKRSSEYANSFEDFLFMIKSTQDLEVLKRIRYDIVTEIIQETATKNIQRAQGLGPENSAFSKSDTCQGRKFKRYISQLTYAKNACECHMQSLGWDEYPVENDDVIDAVTVTTNKILPLRIILDSVIGRKYLSQFLEKLSSQRLIGCWAAIQELRSADESNWHQLGAEIFYTYIATSTTEIKAEKETRKRIESFLLGNTGLDVFVEIQEMIVQTLQEKYYSSFVVSEHYKRLQEFMIDDKLDDLIDIQRSTISETISETTSLLVGDHSNYAGKKLDQLQEKLNNKAQALLTLKSSLKPENKVLSILAKEVEWLQGEKSQLEAHINHTETWTEHLGHWKVDVQSAEFPENGEPPEFVLVVHMVADEADEAGISTGWVVLRKLPEFQDLHQKLRQLRSEIKNLELPSQPLKFFSKVDKTVIEKAKVQIQKYLNFVLEDDRLNQSEALYVFLSPSSERLKHSGTASPKKSRFSLSTLFKSNDRDSIREKGQDEEYSLLLNGNVSSETITDGFLLRGKDSVAEPLYALLGEIFDLRGVFRWLRRSLITFVQLTYGRTINRQIRDTVSWMFSEPMLHYYIQVLMESWWPKGELLMEVSTRTTEIKLKTKSKARQQFLNNVPDLLTNLVGAQSAQRGAVKVFDSLQHAKLNKQLFYEIFEVVMFEMFPGLKNEKE